jgi:hypothetical protein
MPEHDGGAHQVRLVGALAGIGSGMSPKFAFIGSTDLRLLGLTKVRVPPASNSMY